MVGTLVATALPSLELASQVVNAVVSGSSAAELSVPSRAKCKQVHLFVTGSQTLVRIGMSRLSFGSDMVAPPLSGTMPRPLPLPPLAWIGPLPAEPLVPRSGGGGVSPPPQASVSVRLEASIKADE